MATKEEKTAPAAAPEAETVTLYDPWRDMKEIVLPRHGKDEEHARFVAVNGRNFQVPRSGKPVLVPAPVYEVLRNSEELKVYSDERKEELARQAE